MRVPSMMRIFLLAAILCLSSVEVVSGEEPRQTEQVEEGEQVEPPTETPTEPEVPIEPETSETAPVSPQTISDDPCEVRAASDEERLDKVRREVFETVCDSARWFDSFFGSRRFDEEARRTNGRLGARVIYDEHEGFELDGTLKVRVEFPNLDHRINAFLGRDDERDFLAGADDNLDFLPTFFEREGGQEWLLGLGYRPVGTDRSSLDFDAGVEVESPVDPFVRARYRYYWLISGDNLLRARQTVYWTNQRGVGTGTRVDFERPVSSRTLARWTGSLVFDDETEGGDWDTGITLYHGFSADQAVAWFVGIDGETGRDVPIETYGTRFTYRQRMLREWFFGELITGVTWPRDDLLEERELAWHVGFGFEIQFSGEDLGIGF